MRKEQKEIQRARKTFIELILFVAFLIVLYLVSFSNRDPHWFYVTQHIQQELVHNPHTSTWGASQRFSKVNKQYQMSNIKKWIIYGIQNVFYSKFYTKQSLCSQNMFFFKEWELRYSRRLYSFFEYPNFVISLCSNTILVAL